MIKLEYKNRNTIIFFKSLFNTMIPESRDNKLPKLSDATNVKDLLKEIFLNKDLKIKLKENLIKIFRNYNRNKNIDYSLLGKEVAESKEIENLIENYLLEAYFTSIFVKKKLSQKTNIHFLDNKIKNKNIASLLGKIKNSEIRYKKI